MTPGTPADFYDDLAGSYHRTFPDWEASLRRQGDALHAVMERALGPGPRAVLDCAVGIGTQLLGLARHGHRMTGSDVSPGAVGRARAECARRGVEAELAVADMRALPFPDAAFDVVVCADNSLPHLLISTDVRAALMEMGRVARPGGLILVTVRDYDEARATRPPVSAPQLSRADDGLTTVTFQLWEWRPDGERYDLRHFQVTGADDRWHVTHRRTAYWALTRAQLSELAVDAGLLPPEWRFPPDTGFYQPLMLTRAPAS